MADDDPTKNPFGLFGSLMPSGRDPFDFTLPRSLPTTSETEVDKLAKLLAAVRPAKSNSFRGLLSDIPESAPRAGLGDLPGIFGAPSETAFGGLAPRDSIVALLSGLQPSALPVAPLPPARQELGTLGGFFGLPTDNPFSGLAPRSPLDALTSSQPRRAIPVSPLPVAPRPALPVKTKRKAFFSFHFDDVMRVNVVRNAWKITHPENALMRSFYDSSLWESRKLEGEVALKRLIREGVQYTSAVCVLVGSDTWSRQWVRYEIARAVIDGRGLLAVHLNSIRHHRTLTAHTRGLNPLDFMAVGKIQVLGGYRYYLYEKLYVGDGYGGYEAKWYRYENYREPVTVPPWLDDPAVGYVTPLSNNADIYDYIADGGHKNIGAWIDWAAARAGR